MTLGDIIARAVEWVTELWPFAIVTQWEQGVRLTFGRAGGPLRPGLHAYWPLIGEIITADTNIETDETDVMVLECASEEMVAVSVTYEFRIFDLCLLYSQIHDHADTIAAEVRAAVGESVPLIDRDSLADNLGKNVHDELREKLEEWGVELLKVAVTNLADVRAFRLFTDN